MSKRKLKMNKIQDLMGKRNLFFWSLPISPWASFATWLHLEAPPENTEKINKYRLSNFELVLTHTVLELDVFGIARKLSMPFVTLCKKFKKSLKLTAQGLPKTQSTIIWFQGILRIKFRSYSHKEKDTFCACSIKFYRLGFNPCFPTQERWFNLSSVIFDM